MIVLSYQIISSYNHITYHIIKRHIFHLYMQAPVVSIHFFWSIHFLILVNRLFVVLMGLISFGFEPPAGFVVLKWGKIASCPIRLCHPYLWFRVLQNRCTLVWSTIRRIMQHTVFLKRLHPAPHLSRVCCMKSTELIPTCDWTPFFCLSHSLTAQNQRGHIWILPDARIMRVIWWQFKYFL